MGENIGKMKKDSTLYKVYKLYYLLAADNGGIQTSYRAFRRWIETQEHQHDSPLLPGLNYTSNQLFFIGFAQVWCSVNTPEALKLQLRNDPHTPSEYRVIGTLSNTAQFSTAFHCPPGSPMNPPKKCAIWWGSQTGQLWPLWSMFLIEWSLHQFDISFSDHVYHHQTLLLFLSSPPSSDLFEALFGFLDYYFILVFSASHTSPIFANFLFCFCFMFYDSSFFVFD